jgi:uncharacterized protein (TIGR00106 family)
MSVIATLSTTPTRDEDAGDAIAGAIEALDDYEVEYEVNPMGTTIETDDIDELFAAVQAAHQTIEADRVTTRLEISHERDRDRSAAERVAAVEEALSSDSGMETSADATGVEEQDTVDMSGHAPEETSEDPEESDTGMKGGDYKADESEGANDEPLSEKYDGTNEDS